MINSLIKFCFVSVAIFFLALSPLNKINAVEKYSMQSRFGAAFEASNNRNIDEFPWNKLKLGWYFDWGWGSADNGGSRSGMNYLAMVGRTRTSETCAQVTNYIQTHSSKYPNGTIWTVGDRLGIDDNRSPLEAASDYVYWRDCLKGINITFQVGTGAIDSFWVDTFPNRVQVCTGGGINDPRSGKQYFIQYINSIPSNKKPDFVVNNSSLNCVPGSSDSQKMTDQLQQYRQTMKDLGLQNKDLFIKAYGTQLKDEPTPGVNLTFDQRQIKMRTLTDILATLKDNQIGNPDDENRLVQKWAWFILNDNKISNIGWDRVTALANTINGELTPLGDQYRKLIYRYANIPVIADDRIGLAGDDSGPSNLGLVTARAWGNFDWSIEKYWYSVGVNTFFTVGKFDALQYTSRNGGPPTDGHPKCLIPGNDTPVRCVDHVNTPGVQPNDSSYDSLTTMVSAYPGAIWEISNEPDWNPYIAAKDYAVWYKLFSDRILSLDSNAKIMIGGLLSSNHNLIWRVFKNVKCDLDLEYCNAANEFEWVNLFRNHYLNFYGNYPRVHIWSIHTYGVGGAAGLPETAQVMIDRIKLFRNRLETVTENNTISDRNKPLFITETGSLLAEGEMALYPNKCLQHACLSQAQQEYEWDLIGDVGNNLFFWATELSGNSNIQKLFWYYWGPEWMWAGVNNSSVVNQFYREALVNFPSYMQISTEPTKLALYVAKAGKSSTLFNKSFELHDASFRPYAWNLAGTSGGNVEVSTEANYSGGHGIKLTGPNSSQIIVGQNMPTNYFSGKSMQISAWCRIPNGGLGSIRVTYTKESGERVNYGPSLVLPNMCQSWTKLTSNSFVLPNEAISFDIELIGYMSNGQTVYFDEAEITIVQTE